MEAGSVAFVSSFDPVSGETDYEECLVMEMNKDAGKAKVAYATENGYGKVENFVPTDSLVATKETE